MLASRMVGTVATVPRYLHLLLRTHTSIDTVRVPYCIYRAPRRPLIDALHSTVVDLDRLPLSRLVPGRAGCALGAT